MDDPDAVGDPETLDKAHRVFAGTINGSGVLEVRVTRRAGENTLARVVQMVAQRRGRPVTDAAVHGQIPARLRPGRAGAVALLLFAPLVLDESFGESFYRAMAVLVAASPWRSSPSPRPSAVLSGVARAGRGGVLIKGGGAPEELGTLTAIAFDKTGTITRGEPRLTDVAAAEARWRMNC